MTTDSHFGHGSEWKPPRRFHLFRNHDVSGISGTGLIAEGAVWSSGAVALHWPGHPRATSVWASIHDVIEVHGHEGATEIQWLDDGQLPPKASLDQPTQPKRDSKGWPIYDPRD